MANTSKNQKRIVETLIVNIDESSFTCGSACQNHIINEQHYNGIPSTHFNHETQKCTCDDWDEDFKFHMACKHNKRCDGCGDHFDIF